MNDAEKIAREMLAGIVVTVTHTDVAKPVEDALRAAHRAGYEAAREQAAKVADAETGKTPHGNYDYGPNVAHRIRAAIRNMEPDNVAP